MGCIRLDSWPWLTTLFPWLYFWKLPMALDCSKLSEKWGTESKVSSKLPIFGTHRPIFQICIMLLSVWQLDNVASWWIVEQTLLRHKTTVEVVGALVNAARHCCDHLVKSVAPRLVQDDGGTLLTLSHQSACPRRTWMVTSVESSTAFFQLSCSHGSTED